MVRSFAVTLLALAAWWQLLSQPHSGSAALLATAAVVVAGLAVALLAPGGRLATALTAGPQTSRTRALHAKSARAIFQRQLNPDAAGHIRPRAPGAIPAAA